MKPDFITVLIEGKIEEPVAPLVLTDARKTEYQGSGRLIWNRGGEINIECTTGCDELLLKKSTSFLPPGKFYTGAEFWRLKGELPSRGWKFSTREITDHPSISYLGSIPVAMWRIRPREVHFTQTVRRSLPNSLEGIITPSFRFLCTKNSRITDENPVFGWTSDRTDWWEMKINDVQFHLRDVDNTTTRFRINQAGKQFGSLYRWARAFITSLSFLYGQRIPWIGFQAYIKQDILYVLPGNHEIEPAPFPPLGRHLDPDKWKDRESVLSCATRFFRTPKSRTVEKLLYLYWGSFSAFLPAQALLMASILEGLLRSLQGSLPSTFFETPTLIKEIATAQSLLRRHQTEFSSNFMNRVCGMLNSFNKPRSKDILQKIRETACFQVTDGEIEAWDRIRNPHSHGDFSQWVKDIQSGWDRIASIANLINKTIFFLINYEGPHVNYSERGYPECAFTAKRGGG